MSRRTTISLSLLIAICLVAGTAWGQCSMCRTALENSPEGKALAGSFNDGILFLMAVPYALFGTAGIVVYRAYRKKAARKRNLYIP